MKKLKIIFNPKMAGYLQMMGVKLVKISPDLKDSTGKKKIYIFLESDTMDSALKLWDKNLPIIEEMRAKIKDEQATDAI